MAAILIEPTKASKEEIVAAYRRLIADLVGALDGAYVHRESVDDHGYPVVEFAPAEGPLAHRRATLRKSWWTDERLPLHADLHTSIGTRVRFAGPIDGDWMVFTSDSVRMRMPWTPQSIRTLVDDLLDS